MAKKNYKPPTAKDRADFKAKFKGTPNSVGVGLKRDDQGVFVHTHRARSKSYSGADKIPKKVVKFIESTG